MSNNLVGFKAADGVEHPDGSVTYGPNQGQFMVGEAFKEHAVNGVIYTDDPALRSALEDFPDIVRVEQEAPEGTKPVPAPYGTLATYQESLEAGTAPHEGAILQGGEQDPSSPQSAPSKPSPTSAEPGAPAHLPAENEAGKVIISTTTLMGEAPPAHVEVLKNAEAGEAIANANTPAEHADDTDATSGK